jgi:trehalose 6-phosphate synthase
MRLIVRLLAGIWIATLLLTAGFTYAQVHAERERLTADLARRSMLLAEGLKEAIEPAMRRPAGPALARVLKKFATPERRLAVHDTLGNVVAAAPTPLIPTVPEVSEALTRAQTVKGLRGPPDARVYVYVTVLEADARPVGALTVLLDASHVEAVDQGLWQANSLRFAALASTVSLVTLLVVRASITRPLSAMADWARTLKRGVPMPPPGVADVSLFGPLAVEMTGLARTLYRTQAAAEAEASLRLRGDARWTEERLRQFVKLRLAERSLFVISNREPVSHVRTLTGRVVEQIPASGVVTALEPVMRACGGVWVAHGSGNADRQTADARGRLPLPGDDPRYTLRRVWLSPEEEAGYYYGFANEGLWPLCHVVHARPAFRPEDWAHYQAVNRKFAVAVLSEMDDHEAPLVLIQDYHFALVPSLIKAERPDARIALFWHIPWPNAEAFDICPWQEPIVAGMLGADVIGFHTQYHCNNFLETIDRTLEARIDTEHFAVVRGRQVTLVKPFPISVSPAEGGEDRGSRRELLGALGIDAEFLGVGVERVDYTKGLPERFAALRRFFELHPEYRERLVFVQLAAPSRTRIARYRDYRADVAAAAEAVNAALQTPRWRPIVYLERHHEREEIGRWYRHADFCMVTSLHDGMNLVAKEFVAARTDGDGVLILSRMTGAARELREALLVNPYDVDATAAAIRVAVEMPPAERRARMQRMHGWVREHNVYRWAGRLIDELSRVPERSMAAPR